MRGQSTPDAHEYDAPLTQDLIDLWEYCGACGSTLGRYRKCAKCTRLGGPKPLWWYTLAAKNAVHFDG